MPEVYSIYEVDEQKHLLRLADIDTKKQTLSKWNSPSNKAYRGSRDASVLPPIQYHSFKKGDVGIFRWEWYYTDSHFINSIEESNIRVTEVVIVENAKTLQFIQERLKEKIGYTPSCFDVLFVSDPRHSSNLCGILCTREQLVLQDDGNCVLDNSVLTLPTIENINFQQDVIAINNGKTPHRSFFKTLVIN